MPCNRETVEKKRLPPIRSADCSRPMSRLCWAIKATVSRATAVSQGSAYSVAAGAILTAWWRAHVDPILRHRAREALASCVQYWKATARTDLQLFAGVCTRIARWSMASARINRGDPARCTLKYCLDPPPPKMPNEEKTPIDAVIVAWAPPLPRGILRVRGRGRPRHCILRPHDSSASTSGRLCQGRALFAATRVVGERSSHLPYKQPFAIVCACYSISPYPCSPFKPLRFPRPLSLQPSTAVRVFGHVPRVGRDGQRARLLRDR